METHEKNAGSTSWKPLRLWPGIVIVVLQWLARFGIPGFVPNDMVTQIGIFIGLLGGLAIVVWWGFFSRAPLFDRWFAILLMIVSLIATFQFIDTSIATAMMGLMFIIYSIPVMSLAFVIWAVAGSRLPVLPRRLTMVAVILLASGFWAFIRTEGMDGEARHDFAWRWAKTAEERLVSQAGDQLSPVSAHIAAAIPSSGWPGFRGPNRDAVIHGVRIKTDWSESPPAEIWRRPIGPGCSSVAMQGNLIYTQEQRGEYEMVSCYKLNTGEPVWRHSDTVRFWDSHAGAGPRSTPTLSNGRVYTLGATGILNALDAYSGTVIWSLNAATNAGVGVQPWGFTASPLVVGNMVIVALSGKLAAYDTATGKPAWVGTDGGNSYSSPHLVTIDGVLQVILMSKAGAVSVDPATGKQLWKYAWPIEDRILQPAVISPTDLMFAGETNGACRVSVSHIQKIWTVKERWRSAEMKLNFNDFIIHKGVAYGFDGPRIACVDIKYGKCIWKGSPYRGWLLLLADQDLLVVLTEKGKLALVNANRDQFKELALIPAVDGKTWNHPALAGDVLVVRNSQEMAAFRLPLAAK